MATKQKNGNETGKSGDDAGTAGGPAAAFPAALFAGPFTTMMEGPMREMMAMQSAAARQMMDAFLPAGDSPGEDSSASADSPSSSHANEWQALAAQLTAMWQQFARDNPALAASGMADPAQWMELTSRWMTQFMPDDEASRRLLADSFALWETMAGQFMTATAEAQSSLAELPRSDKRFAAPQWRDNPVFAMLHQSYLMAAEQIMDAAAKAEGLPADRKLQLSFFTRLLTEAMSPAHFPLTNPVVIERTLETGGENLVKGMTHFLSDLQAGQLTHTDKAAFTIGENIASTPGKVVHETPLFQMIQYTPTTDKVLSVPLVIFPPWINRFYILDLTPKKSFVKYCLDQGISTFMVSWKSADASMADIGWEDYVAAQEEAIDVIRERLKVPAVHAIGYCVAGTTLAATLASLSRRGEDDKVASATFFTAQVDFSEAGELKAFIDEQQLAAVDSLATEGFLDGRYLSLAFNLLRSPDLLWNYVINNYLLGEDYKPFDLLYWNGHGTNLPARFHREYLRKLYHDNLLVVPDAITLNDTPIDLSKVRTPCFVQAGREDHIAPAKSVWKLTQNFSGATEFMLAGSGHIAGVVNPPEARKYQFWSLPGEFGDKSRRLPETLAEFLESAVETPGSWWDHWTGWIRSIDAEEVAAKGKRKPGGRGDTVIEDAPGRYVKS
ncbi:MAG: class I poly(R)-hydroxyalkanoic acid synthase [Paracoccus sp.]|nr:class I poly(R)-hydroxyalkanoic acid synthase [Croceicoccus sp.]MAN58158.1 class I poly(R)-hydroxyalkanoic acid synthase [Paracoccus sp. (in: a-proteobacteria)]MAN58162.1 class I poly(R)-hydroxyalkanoic acid synthase [Paracoccus sp. (in: a-proteobacteria)]|tara:strand:- start:90150 stop:92156 length:2007 start_codon:yes stop_codon:yes gene_type:complete